MNQPGLLYWQLKKKKKKKKKKGKEEEEIIDCKPLMKLFGA